jgi:hypothetical protein
VPQRLSFRDRFYTRRTAQAITSPLAILAAGGGAAAGILLGLPIAAAVAVGAVAWAGRVLLGMPKATRGADMDPFTLSEPWRQYFGAARAAKLRFDRTVTSMRPGPLQERLREVGTRIDTGIDEAWRVAGRGADLDAAIRQLDPNLVQAQLREAQQLPAGPTRDATVTSLQSQWATVDRVMRVREDASNHLRTLDARLDELVARAVELSVTGAADIGGLGGDVDTMVSDMESLRQALEETKSAAELGGGSLPRSLPSSTPSPQQRQQPS